MDTLLCTLESFWWLIEPNPLPERRRRRQNNVALSSNHSFYQITAAAYHPHHFLAPRQQAAGRSKEDSGTARLRLDGSATSFEERTEATERQKVVYEGSDGSALPLSLSFISSLSSHSITSPFSLPPSLGSYRVFSRTRPLLPPPLPRLCLLPSQISSSLAWNMNILELRGLKGTMKWPPS